MCWPPPVRRRCPVCPGITAAGLSGLPLIPLSWRQEKWRTRMAATPLLPSPKVSSCEQKTLLQTNFSFSFSFFLNGQTVKLNHEVPVGCLFQFILSVFERWRWINRETQVSPSPPGHGSGINYQPTHSTGCFPFIKHDLFFKLLKYFQFYLCCRSW